MSSAQPRKAATRSQRNVGENAVSAGSHHGKSTTNKAPVPTMSAPVTNAKAAMPTPLFLASAGGALGQDGAAVATVSSSADGAMPTYAGTVPSDATFTVTPQQLLFLSFEPNQTYEAVLTFTNRTHENQFLRVARPQSRFFSLTAPKGSESTLKVAPGLMVRYTVIFTPEELADYQCELNVMTDHEEFTIPVRAFFSRGQLELPREVTLHDAPVRASSSTSLFVRNPGKTACQWRAVFIEDDTAMPLDDASSSATPLFAVNPSCGTVAAEHGVLPVELLFFPGALQSYHGRLRFYLGAEGDMIQDVQVTGSGVEVDVSIDSRSLTFEETYVTTDRELVITVHNNSDQTLPFTWKQDSNGSDEQAWRATHAQQMLATMSAAAGSDAGYGDADAGSALTLTGTCGGGDVDWPARLDTLRHAPHMFDDDVFSIEPMSGVIYGNGAKHFTVTFSPQLATASLSLAYLDIAGRGERLPVQLSGRGVGPQCVLEFSRIPIGDVYMNALHEYAVDITNVGAIEARFSVLPSDTLLGKRFAFEPSAGVLAPGEVQTLRIRLQSDLIGIISEMFHIHLHGSTEDLSLEFRGRVVGPSFQFDVDELDFGNVSYNFWHARTLHISNTGQVPMVYRLHLPHDSPYLKEFQITPCRGAIEPGATERIQLDYLSNSVGECETALMVDIEDVGNDVESLPVRSACLVPPLYASVEKLNFGRCFVGHDYSLNVEVVNDTAMSGKFELVLVDEAALSGLASVTIGDADRQDGITILEPRQKTPVAVLYRALRTGNISFSIGLRVVGAAELAQVILVSANACGPNVEFGAQQLNFGSLPLLQSRALDLVVTNTSPIPAHFTAAFRNAPTGSSTESVPHVFCAEPPSGSIEPYESLTLKVVACLDEACPFSDELRLHLDHVEESAVKPISLKAIGTGFALVCETDLSSYDVGDVFTDTPVERTFHLINKGRRPQEVQWQNVRGTKVKEGSQPITFTLSPDRVLIPARGTASFTVAGLCKDVGNFSDSFALKQVGTFKEILRAVVHGNFVAPVIQYSTRQLAFEYVHTDTSAAPSSLSETRSFTMKNTTTMQLDVVLKLRDAKVPFSLEGPSTFSLPSGATAVVGVRFNPGFFDDFKSFALKSRLLVAFANHPHTESVRLSATTTFPSVEIDPPARLDFGVILKDTEEQRDVTLTNPSDAVAATFEWKLRDYTSKQRSKATTPSVEEAVQTDDDVARRFDFVPYSGTIAPGGSQVVKATFYGRTGVHKATAVCEILGGPPHELELRGSAGDVSIQYDTTSLDFGVLQYYDAATRTITISNPSRVAANFDVSLFPVKHRDCLKVTPMTGVVVDKVQLSVQFTPTIPDFIEEIFTVQVGHFDPQEISVVGRGQVNTVSLWATDAVVTVERDRSVAGLGAMIEEVRRDTKDGAELVPYIQRTSEFDLQHSGVEKHVNLVQLEAERRAFCQCLLNEGKMKRQSVSRLPSNAATGRPPMPQRSPSPRDASKLTPRRHEDPEEDHAAANSTGMRLPERRVMRRNSTTAGGATKQVLATYIVDFGHMTRNDVRTTKVRLVNTCPNTLFLMLDKKELAKLPLEVEPVKVPKLDPLEAVTFDITLDARVKEADVVSSGANAFEFALDVKGGPTVVVRCVCYVATPELKVSESEVDFGPVPLGQVRVMPFRLFNEQAVPCQWRLAFRRPKRGKTATVSTLYGTTGAAAAAVVDDLSDAFPLDSVWASAEKGVLGPSESKTLDLFFAPTQLHACEWRLVLRYTNNDKAREVLCRGMGRQVKVAVSPSPLNFHVVKPFQVVHETVKITNYEDTPVELFSYNLDGQHAAEQRMLTYALRRSPNGRLLLPVRHAGEALSEDVLNAVYVDLLAQESQLKLQAATFELDPFNADATQTAKEDDEKAGAAATGASASGAASGAKSGRKGNAGASGKRRGSARSGSVSSATGVNEASVGDAAETAPRPSPKGLVVFVGPTYAGKTTQAQLLQSALGYKTLDLERLIMSEAERDSASGEVLRNVLSALTTLHGTSALVSNPEELADPRLTGPPPPVPKPVTPLDDPLLHYVLDGGAAPQPPAGSPMKSFLGTLPSTASFGTFTGTSSRRKMEDAAMQAAASETLAAYAPMMPVVIKTLMRQCVRAHLSDTPDAGFVVDGLWCRVVPNPVTVFTVISEVCVEVQCPVKVVSLALSEAEIGLRRCDSLLQVCTRRTKQAYLEPLPEEAYEALSAEDRETYNRRLKYYNECRREMNSVAVERKAFEGLLQREAPLTVQESVARAMQQEKEAEAALAAQSGSKGGAKKPAAKGSARGKEVDVEVPPLDWTTLSPLDAFKECHRQLLRYEEERSNDKTAAAAPSGKKNAAAAASAAAAAVAERAEGTKEADTVPSLISVVSANKPASTVSDVVVTLCTDSDGLLLDQIGNTSVVSFSDASGQSSPLNASRGASSRAAGASGTSVTVRDVNETSGGAASSTTSPPPLPPYLQRDNNVGQWWLVDSQRMTEQSYQPVENVRFFSVVDREVQSAVKKAAKGKVVAPTSTTVRHYEETTRWMIPARSSVFVTVEFCCDREGTHRILCDFGIVGTAQVMQLMVNAQTVLPDVSRDDADIFGVSRTRNAQRPASARLWMPSRRMYDFGPLLIPPPIVKETTSNKRRKSSRNSVSTTGEAASVNFVETLTLSNQGIAPAEVQLSFQNDKEKAFSVIPAQFTLNVGGSQQVTLCANPTAVGEFRNRLIACVKGNPNPWSADVRCVGSKPAVTIDGEKNSTVDFGRSVLNVESERTLELANTSAMPIRWSIADLDKLPAELRFSETSGLIEEKTTAPLTVWFCPGTTCLHNVPLALTVTDAVQTSLVYETIPVTLKAEGHDVVLEWTREVDFGLLHVGDVAKDVIRIMNKSPYDVGFMLRLPKRLQDIVTLTPQTGTIRGMMGHKDAAIATIEVTARFEKEGEIPAKLGAIETAFFEPEKQELLYPLQTITLRGEAWYTRYAVKPTSLDFGSCFYHQGKQASFEVRNTGRFPVTYTLFDYRQGWENTDVARLQQAQLEAAGASAATASGGATAAATTRPTSASVKSGKHGKAPKVDPDFRLGCFTVTPATGVIPVGEVQLLTVSTVPEPNARTRETLGLHVDRSEPELDAKGVPVELAAHPAYPGIAADLNSMADVETIFEEQQVVFRLDQFDRTVRAYGKENRTFTFGVSLVGHRIEERFRLANNSPLPCTVVAQLTAAHTGGSAEGGVGASGTNSSSKNSGPAPAPDVFDIAIAGETSSSAAGLQPVKVVLPPFESRLVTVSFTPSGLQRFDARFVAVVENAGDSARIDTLAFGLTGEGTLPNVTYTLPDCLYPSQIDGVTAGGAMTSNNSVVSINSAVSVKTGSPKGSKRNTTTATSSANAAAASTSGVKVGRSATTGLQGKKSGANNAQANASCDLVQLPLTLVGASASRFFTIENAGCVAADVRLTIDADEDAADGLNLSKKNRDVTIPVASRELFEVTYNPTRPGTSTMRIKVALMDNPFEEKELIVEARAFEQEVSFTGIDPAHSDFWSFGDCYVHQGKEETFRMYNNTDSDLRFEWTTAPIARFVPSVGHLPARAYKTITACVTPTETGVLRKQLPCEVSVQSIERFETTDWDNSMANQKWVVVEEDTRSGAAASSSLFSHPQGAGRGLNDTGRRNLRRVLEPVPEPGYRFTDAVTTSQPLTVAYSCCVPSYAVEVVDTDGNTNPQLDAIAFEPTKMFQRRVATVRVCNTSQVSLPYSVLLTSPTGPASAVGGASSPIATTAAPSPTSDGAAVDSAVASPGGVMSPTKATTVDDVFMVEPSEGTLAAGEHADIAIAFSPTAPVEYQRTLVLRFPHSEKKKVYLPMSGQGECPLVHFHIPDSTDYLEQRVDGEAGAAIDPDTLVLSFAARGLHTRTPYRFKVLNPTATSYPYEWREKSEPGAFGPFRCLTPSGMLGAGKQVEMAFEFSSETLGVRESKWVFEIPGRASVPFLLVGKTTDPAVSFSSSKVNFGGINVGTRLEKVVLLENRDEVPFPFNFVKSEMAGTSSFLTVKPLSGTIGPHEKIPVSILFTPQDEMEYNIPLVCQVKKASIPLTINVKGEGINIHDSLQIETPEEPPVTAAKGRPTMINFGRVQVDETAMRRLILSNQGQHAFDYELVAPARRFLVMENMTGTILPRQRVVIPVTYHPTSEESLRQYRMQMKINGKTCYPLGLQATTYIPKLNLSFDKYDFGPRLIAQFNPHATEILTTLSVTNNDMEMITVDCAVSDGNDWLDLDTSSFVAKPNATTDVTLRFFPRDLRAYDDKLRLLLNGVYPVYIPISGEGVAPRVEVLNRFAKLGVARVGELREVEVRLDCRSRVPTPVSFVGCVDEDLVNKGISVSPSEPFVMKPRESRLVKLYFKPTQRMGEFQREMKMLVCGKEFPFVTLSGSCQDSEVHLDTTMLTFDDIVVGSSAKRRVVIMNSGDISQQFSWRGLKSCADLFMTPQSGFLRSHTEMLCEVTYAPQSAASVLQRTLTVEFDNAPAMSVLVEGTACARPPAHAVVQFQCRARESVAKKITIENPSTDPWTFEAALDTDTFKGPSGPITIKPKGKTELTVEYHPMRETFATDPDLGSLFVPRSDGTGQTYVLEGRAEAPGPSGPTREVEVSVGVPATLKVEVENWATSPQRFMRDITWTPAAEEGVLLVKAPATLEIPARASKEYTVGITAMRDGLFRGTISFQCPERPDLYQYVEVVVKVASAPSLKAIDLRTTVRTATTHNVTISNPLNKAATLQCKLDGGADVLTVPPSIMVPSRSAVNLPIQFLPLMEKEYPAVKLNTTSAELGNSTFLLCLHASPAPPETVTRLVCPLGQSVTFPLRFMHFAKGSAEFAIRLASATAAATTGTGAETGSSRGGSSNGRKNNDAAKSPFTKLGQGNSVKVASSSAGSKGQEVTCEFTFEPTCVGSVKEVIELVSATAGTYTFPIMATCTAPQRQGPFRLRPGQSTAIPFRNVFSETVSITVTTDDPTTFAVGKKSENVPAKKSITIPVQCKMADNVEVAHGKMVVSCLPPGEMTPVEWVYYLECSRTDNSATRKSVVRKR